MWQGIKMIGAEVNKLNLMHIMTFLPLFPASSSLTMIAKKWLLKFIFNKFYCCFLTVKIVKIRGEIINAKTEIKVQIQSLFYLINFLDIIILSQMVKH